MTYEQEAIKQVSISDLAEKYLDEAISNGDSFSESLCNWAMNKAKDEGVFGTFIIPE